MDLANPGTVPVYTLAGANATRQLPEWLVRKNRRQLKQDDEWARRVSLLQDFEFQDGSTKVRVSEDGQWVVSTGMWKPQFHVHNLNQLSLSYAHHTVSLNKTFQLLSADYSKSIHLQEDRRIELYTPFGCHHHVRLPRFGRDLVYDRYSCEALVPSVGLDTSGMGEVFRLNLERGTFMKSFQVEVGADEGVERGLQGSIDVGSVNTGAVAHRSHGMYAFGTSLGSVEFWDGRMKSRIATLQSRDEGEVSAVEFSPSGMGLTVGSSTGTLSVYDMRSPVPLLKKDHGYGFPIKNIIYLSTASQEPKILSADKRAIKIFGERDGQLWTSIEPTVDLNDVAHVKGSGMLLTANEGQAQHAFHIPQLGPAPSWCRFVENMVEELAEMPAETYENYKFVTIPELKSLSLSHLIGKTNLLRPYMHGYFVASKLYDQARLISNPYVWEEERLKRVKEKVEKERASRIRGNKKVKVNQKIVDRLLKRQERREKVDTEAGLLGDERFKSLFEDEEFKVDENSREFRALNPSTQVEGRGETGSTDNRHVNGEESSEGEETDDQAPIRKPDPSVVMRVSSSTQRQGGRTQDIALGSRTQKSGRISKVRRGDAVGERQVTFVPEAKSKGKQLSATPAAKRAPGSRRSASGNTFRNL